LTDGRRPCYFSAVNQVATTDTVEAVKALVPAFDQDSELKRSFIGWRLCGFNPVESLLYTGIHPTKLREWAQDPEFAALNTPDSILRLGEEAKTHLVNTELHRNHRLVLKVDGDILKKAAINGVGILTDREAKLLEKIRPVYTPKVITALGLGDGEPPVGSWEQALKFMDDAAETARNLSEVVLGDQKSKSENTESEEIELQPHEYKSGPAKAIGAGVSTEQKESGSESVSGS
jgi:hypothetical protein